MEMCRQRFQKERNKMVLKGVVSPHDGLLADKQTPVLSSFFSPLYLLLH